MSTATAVEKHYFKHQNIKYFRSKSENVRLGSFGRKNDPIGAMAYLSVVNHVSNANLAGRARYMGWVDVDWDEQSKADVESQGEVTYLTLSGSGTASAGYADARKADLKLVKFGIDQGVLATMLNTDADGARKFLANEGNDGRIVSEVFTAVEARIAESFARSAASGGAIKAALTKALSLEFRADHAVGTSGSVEVVLSPGTTFAYGMHKVTRWNKGKTRVERLEDDRKGMG